jgi:hypothetical protein
MIFHGGMFHLRPSPPALRQAQHARRPTGAMCEDRRQYSQEAKRLSNRKPIYPATRSTKRKSREKRNKSREAERQRVMPDFLWTVAERLRNFERATTHRGW